MIAGPLRKSVTLDAGSVQKGWDEEDCRISRGAGHRAPSSSLLPFVVIPLGIESPL